MKLDIQNPVDVKEQISAEEFNQQYLLPEKPVVLKNLWKDYPAHSKWTTDYFKQELGDVQVGLFDSDSKNDRSFKKPHMYMKFGDYLDLISSNKPTNLRIFLFNIFKHKPELKKDFDFPPITDTYLKRFPFMFFGGKNAVVRIHQDMDMSNVFLTQLHGKKRVVLFEPKYSKLLYRYPFTVHSSVNIDDPDFEQFPGLKYVKGMTCELDHGDTLFIPSGYWHYITYLEGGFAISVRALAPHISRRLEGFWRVAILSTLDDLFRNVLGKKWFTFKHKLAHLYANRQIAEIERNKEAKKVAA